MSNEPVWIPVDVPTHFADWPVTNQEEMAVLMEHLRAEKNAGRLSFDQERVENLLAVMRYNSATRLAVTL
jgi:hypothetical protein